MIILQNIQKKFGNKQLFRDFSLHIKPGEFVGIMGKSGQGKTTLLNMIGTLESADAGIVKINGRQAKGSHAKRLLLRENLGFIFQNYALIDNATVKENLEIALTYKKGAKKKKADLLAKALQKVGLTGYEAKKICTLSGGEQQRISIARLLLKDPPIILADEPTGSLDPVNRDHIIALFQELHRTGKTIVMVTHDKELRTIFSRIVDLGRMEQ